MILEDILSRCILDLENIYDGGLTPEAIEAAVGGVL